MKRYLVFLLLLGSCNGLSRYTVYNADHQVGSNQDAGAGGHQRPVAVNGKKLAHLTRSCLRKLSRYYDLLASRFSKPEEVLADIYCFIFKGKLPFIDPNSDKILRKATELWNRGDRIFTEHVVLKAQDKELNGEDLKQIPYQIRNLILDDASLPLPSNEPLNEPLAPSWPVSSKYKDLLESLDGLAETMFASFIRKNPTARHQLDYLKILLVRHFNEIEQKFSKLVPLKPRFSNTIIQVDTPFALVVYLGSMAMLDDFLHFIKLKNIKISLKDKQITEIHVSGSPGYLLSGGVSQKQWSPLEYLADLEWLGPVKYRDILRKYFPGVIDECLDRKKPYLSLGKYLSALRESINSKCKKSLQDDDA